MLWTSIIPIGSMAVMDIGALITVLSLSFLDPASSERHASVDAVFAPWRIFKPLGMTDTRFQDGHTEVVRRRATGYRAAEEGRWRVNMPRSDLAGPSDLMRPDDQHPPRATPARRATDLLIHLRGGRAWCWRTLRPFFPLYRRRPVDPTGGPSKTAGVSDRCTGLAGCMHSSRMRESVFLGTKCTRHSAHRRR